MQSETLELVRRTKLEVAQWIAAGMGQCTNPVTSQCLARYAAAQLEAAAIIPASPTRSPVQTRCASLLRNELGSSRKPNGHECIAILARVSRAMLVVLAGNSPDARRRAMRDVTTVRLMRHEARAAKLLAEMLPKKAAA